MDVQVETKNGIKVISFNRPDKKNALVPNMYLLAADAIRSASDDFNCHVIVLRGNGNDFTAGNDISEFASANDETIANTVSFMRALLQCPLPVVAEVKGNAIGIGTTLLLHCDFVVSASNSKFMMPFINLGLLPEYASSYLLPRTSGHINAAKWLMLGNAFDAHEAYRRNLITYVCEPEELEEGVREVCNQLINKPRNALIQTKTLLKTNLNAVSEHIDKELALFAKALHSEAAKEAFDAFLNKRPINKRVFLK